MLLQSPMKNPCSTPGDSSCLVDIIEWKWLLTGYGVHVHVEQLQVDPEYARRLFERTSAIPSGNLRAAAARVQAGLLRAQADSRPGGTNEACDTDHRLQARAFARA